MNINHSTNYQTPMEPWPGLDKYAKSIRLQENGLDLFYFENGNEKKPDLLLIHGLGDEADTWRHIFLPLSNEYHVIAVDLPGFGRSAKPKQKYSPRFMMQALQSLIDQMQIKKAILMGNSLGAILSHAIATFKPMRVMGLILVDGALLQNKVMGDLSLRLMQAPLLGEWLYTRLRKDPQAAYDSLRNVYHDLEGLSSADQDFLFRRVNQRVWSNDQRRAYFSTLRNMAPWIRFLQGELPGKLKQMTTPTLVIRGEYDLLFSEQDGLGVASVQPNAIFKTINNVGHLPHQEAPSTLLHIVTEWLDHTFK